MTISQLEHVNVTETTLLIGSTPYKNISMLAILKSICLGSSAVVSKATVPQLENLPLGGDWLFRLSRRTCLSLPQYIPKSHTPYPPLLYRALLTISDMIHHAVNCQ